MRAAWAPVPVAAGERIDLPAVGADEILVARFTPTPDGLPTRVVHLVLKDWFEAIPLT